MQDKKQREYNAERRRRSMISGTISCPNKYDLKQPKFQTAFAFLQRDDLTALPEGWLELENGVRASVQHYTTTLASEPKYETHERFLDIQFMAAGEEWIGCTRREGLTIETPYDAENDITFYQVPLCGFRARGCASAALRCRWSDAGDQNCGQGTGADSAVFK
jgi:hypothetical protein